MILIDIPLLACVLVAFVKIRLTPKKFLVLSLEIIMDFLRFLLYVLKRFLAFVTCCCTCSKCCSPGACCHKVVTYSETSTQCPEDVRPMADDDYELQQAKKSRGMLLKVLIVITYLSFLRTAMAIPTMMIIESEPKPMIRMQVMGKDGVAYKDVTIMPELGNIEDYLGLPHMEESTDPSMKMSEEVKTPMVKDRDDSPDLSPAIIEKFEGTIGTTTVPTDSTPHHRPVTHVEKKDNHLKVVTVFDLDDYLDVEVATEHSH